MHFPDGRHSLRTFSAAPVGAFRGARGTLGSPGGASEGPAANFVLGVSEEQR